jgi:predicted aspartyl protease
LKLGRSELKDIEEAHGTAELLRGAPAQTVTVSGSFTVSTRRDAIGLVETTVDVAGHPEPWIFDTGANFSVATRSLAERLHLSLSNGTTPVYGLGGHASQCHVAVIPLLRLGPAEVRNVAVLVFEDKDLYLAPIKFQIHALLGYPVLAGLGRITFYGDGRFEASPSTGPSALESGGARLLMENFTPLVAVGIGKELRLFRFDTGAVSSDLTVRYWREHRNDFRHQKAGKLVMAGAGGTRGIRIYTAPSVVLTFGGTPLTLRDPSVFTTGDKEYFYGRLGQDAFKPVSAYTLDFVTMQLSVVSQ